MCLWFVCKIYSTKSIGLKYEKNGISWPIKPLRILPNPKNWKFLSLDEKHDGSSIRAQSSALSLGLWNSAIGNDFGHTVYKVPVKLRNDCDNASFYSECIISYTRKTRWFKCVIRIFCFLKERGWMNALLIKTPCSKYRSAVCTF